MHLNSLSLTLIPVSFLKKTIPEPLAKRLFSLEEEEDEEEDEDEDEDEEEEEDKEEEERYAARGFLLLTLFFVTRLSSLVCHPPAGMSLNGRPCTRRRLSFVVAFAPQTHHFLSPPPSLFHRRLVPPTGSSLLFVAVTLSLLTWPPPASPRLPRRRVARAPGPERQPHDAGRGRRPGRLPVPPATAARPQPQRHVAHRRRRRHRVRCAQGCVCVCVRGG